MIFDETLNIVWGKVHFSFYFSWRFRNVSCVFPLFSFRKMSYKTAIQIHKQNSTVALIFSENQISMVTSIVNVNDNSVICIQKFLFYHIITLKQLLPGFVHYCRPHRPHLHLWSLSIVLQPSWCQTCSVDHHYHSQTS